MTKKLSANEMIKSLVDDFGYTKTELSKKIPLPPAQVYAKYNLPTEGMGSRTSMATQKLLEGAYRRLTKGGKVCPDQRSK